MNVQTVPPTHPTTIPVQVLRVVMASSKVTTIVQLLLAVGTIKLNFASCPCCQVFIGVEIVLHVDAEIVPYKEMKARIPKKGNMLKSLFHCDLTKQKV